MYYCNLCYTRFDKPASILKNVALICDTELTYVDCCPCCGNEQYEKLESESELELDGV